MTARKKEAERQDAVERRLEALAAQVQSLEVLLRGHVPQVPDPKSQEATDSRIAALMAQVHHLEVALQTYDKNTSDAKDGHFPRSARRKPRYQCSACKTTNSVCFHCRKCNEVGHYAANCKKNM